MKDSFKQQSEHDMKRIDRYLFKKRELPLTQEKLSLHGLDLHTMDIRTGATPKDVKSYFLPRLDSPDVEDSYDLRESPFFRWGSLLDYPNYKDPIDFKTWKYSLPFEVIQDLIYHSKLISGLDTDR